MSRQLPSTEIPSSWYAVCVSSDLQCGQVRALHYFGRELAIYRTSSGEARVVNAFCPHLGAHLGRVGRVEGDRLRCGFHGLKFDAMGRCVGTPNGAPPPPKARLSYWPVRERNGLILVWYSPRGELPDWAIPAVDLAGWTPLRWKTYSVATTPQETSENSVDFVHYTELHGFCDGSVTQPVHTEGPVLTVAYRAHREVNLLLRKLRLPADYRVVVWGLGYSLVEVSIKPLRLRLRLWVLSTPVDNTNVDLCIAVAVPRRLGPLARLFQWFIHQKICSEVEQDFAIWNHKTYLEAPALMKGEKPIAQYRRWARQFYRESHQRSKVVRLAVCHDG